MASCFCSQCYFLSNGPPQDMPLIICKQDFISVVAHQLVPIAVTDSGEVYCLTTSRKRACGEE